MHITQTDPGVLTATSVKFTEKDRRSQFEIGAIIDGSIFVLKAEGFWAPILSPRCDIVSQRNKMSAEGFSYVVLAEFLF